MIVALKRGFKSTPPYRTLGPEYGVFFARYSLRNKFYICSDNNETTIILYSTRGLLSCRLALLNQLDRKSAAFEVSPYDRPCPLPIWTDPAPSLMFSFDRYLTRFDLSPPFSPPTLIAITLLPPTVLPVLVVLLLLLLLR